MRARRALLPPTFQEKPKTKTGKKGPPKGTKPKTPPPYNRTRKPSIESQITSMEQERLVLSLKSGGLSFRKIAKVTGLSLETVFEAYHRAFAEYLGDHRKFVEQRFAENMAGYDEIKQAYFNAAIGEDNGEPDPKSAEIFMKAAREQSKMCGHGNTMNIEVAGAGGGPITTANVGPMEAARLVREAFGDKVEPYVGNKANGKGR